MKYRPKPMPLDLAVPYGKPLPAEQTHTVQPPPQNDEIVRQVAEILATGAAITTLAAGISALLPDIETSVLLASLGLVNSGTAHTPNNRPSAVGLPHSGSAMQVARGQELYFRAAYLVRAARRMQEDIAEGKPIRTALAQESLHYRQHEAARKGRLNSVAKASKAAEMYGDLLGWYLNPLLNNEIECIHADGNNFSAAEGTVIGYPGAVHPNCGCAAGPPIEGAGMVNDAVASILRTPGGKRIVRLKAVG